MTEGEGDKAGPTMGKTNRRASLPVHKVIILTGKKYTRSLSIACGLNLDGAITSYQFRLHLICNRWECNEVVGNRSNL
ncbi:hypothetical protein GEV33_000163 [Tenebrio molitor]|uniref:Uncharacterized protein n=1 Tax=Tenebrio molitor TaxID=7067 RepID=A0A8J6HZ10_TENMO|nr:hypothetical protein GEV33_000163 [Tenebrio molitor]